MSLLTTLSKRAYAVIWDVVPEDMPFWHASAVHAARIAWVVARDLIEGPLSLRAVSLVYTTLLSLVPVLAISFAILKAFGYDAQLEYAMSEFLAPLGARGTDIIDKTMEFVRNVDIGILGSVGLGFLLYTLFSTIQKIETAFNSIWQVQNNQSPARRIIEFLSVGLLGPLLIVTAISIMASVVGGSLGGLTDAGPVRIFVEQTNRLVPYFVIIAGFSLMYFTIPSTRVNFFPALAGGAVAGVIWGATGWAFATFVVTSARYAAVYSAFASLILFMIWLYAAWLILLTGCSVSFYVQNLRYLSPARGIIQLTAPQRESMALQLLILIHDVFQKGEKPWTEEALGQRLRAPTGAVSRLIAILERRGFLTHTLGRPARLGPGLPADKIRVADVLDVLRAHDLTGSLPDGKFAREPVITRLFDDLAEARAHVLDGLTVADLYANRAAKKTN